MIAEQPIAARHAVARFEQAESRPKAYGIVRGDRLAELALPPLD
jgi:hypothetical protein